MALNLHIKTTLRNSMLDLVNAAIGAGGFLRIYDGAQPATADTALGAQVKLAELGLSASPFAAAGAGAIVANPVSDDLSADATGTASWGSFVTAAGVRILDVAVSTAAADINLNTTAIQVGGKVSLTSYTLSIPA
jgi:hypothetical protein